jgi:hypothetical protein
MADLPARRGGLQGPVAQKWRSRVGTNLSRVLFET